MKVITLFSLFLTIYASNEVTIDPSGYIIYCPCMGRFGNQVEQFLGTLEFARRLNRTLVLPPFLEYPMGFIEAIPKLFDHVFQIKPLKKIAKVIKIEEFMVEIAPIIWPDSKRKVFCWSNRETTPNGKESCQAKDGNPFGPFWNHFGVDFSGDKFYGHIGYDVSTSDQVEKWRKFATHYTVLAFSNPPAPFPAHQNVHQYQQHLLWNPSLQQAAHKFIVENLPRPFTAIHLRNNVDWVHACNHVQPHAHFFSSALCLGQNFEVAKPSKEICFPSNTTVLNQLKEIVEETGTQSVFVSSDNDHMLGQLGNFLGKKINIRKLPNDDLYLALAIMGESDHFVANCMSTYSAVIVRQRKYQNKEQYQDTSFFGIRPQKGLPNEESVESEETEEGEDEIINSRNHEEL